jgi:hypothetical protein
MAIARFGSSPTPLEAFDLKVPDDNPLGFREIVPQETLEIDPETGAVARQYRPDKIRFRDGDHIRPVAPFLEVYAQTGPDSLEPLTLELLHASGLDVSSVYWSVAVGNLKVFRQTGKSDDKVLATVDPFNDHAVHELHGRSANFKADKCIPFGSVRYIRPTAEYPQIRLRFTPAAGRVYGARLTRFNPQTNSLENDPVFDGDDSRIVYDPDKGTWLNFQSDATSVTLTNPSDIYEGYPSPNDDPLAISRGYLDDVCDGPVTVELRLADGTSLKSRSWVSCCMPAFAPDSQPVRTVADELEQLILGPDIEDEEVSIEAAAGIVRRALETVRLMNTQVMNGNVIDGRPNIAHTLITQDTNDYGRLYAPIMASSIVDNLAVRALHDRVYAALVSGSAPWFADVLRRPEEVGDMSDRGRRKMPPMLRGADGRALALTRRQISKVVKAAIAGLFRDALPEAHA